MLLADRWQPETDSRITARQRRGRSLFIGANIRLEGPLSLFAKIFPISGQMAWLAAILNCCWSSDYDIGMPIGFTYSVFHRILDLKTGVYFYTAPFFLRLLSFMTRSRHALAVAKVAIIKSSVVHL